jgi:type I restriction enzyme S subunit
MEVKKGYKQTEVGVIPEDWHLKMLNRISPKQSVGLVINPSTYYSPYGTIPLLVGSNVFENRIDAETSRKITSEANERLSASKLISGDIVVVRVGDPGIAAVVPPQLNGINCASMMIVRKHQSFNSHWLCYLMNSRLGRKQIEDVQYGTAQKQFNISDAVNFLFPVPPTLAEQEAIAGALSDADAWIESLEQLIAKKRQIKQGAMQELLTGKRRLPGFSGEWETKRLGCLAKLKNGYAFKSETYSRLGKFKVITIANVQDGRMDLSEFNTLSCLPSDIQGHQMLSLGDILISMTGNVGRVCQVSDNDCLLNQRVGVLEPTSVSTGFLFQSLMQKDFINGMTNKATGGAQGNLSKADILDWNLPVSMDINEQAAIATVLSDMDSEIESLESKFYKAREVKQGMMQELLTGRIRLV